MATTELTPMGVDTWDEIDTTIYNLRIRQHQSLRSVAQHVNLSHEGVRRRLNRMMRQVTFAEVDEMRTTEGHRLDELSDQNHRIIAAAIANDDLETAQRGLREIHALARTRAQLFGLNEEPDRSIPDAAALNQLAEAYLTGYNDAHTSG